MWVTKQLHFTGQPSPEEGVLLRSDIVQALDQANDLLSRAQQQQAEMMTEAESQAQAIVAAAQAQAESHIATLLAEKEAEFLQRTEALFADWHAARLQQEENLVQQAQQLVSATLEHYFARSDEAQKITALLRQFMLASAREPEATLCCHPHHYDPVATWLQCHPHLAWSIKRDDALPLEHLILQTAHGELSVAWASLQQRLLNAIER